MAECAKLANPVKEWKERLQLARLADALHVDPLSPLFLAGDHPIQNGLAKRFPRLYEDLGEKSGPFLYDLAKASYIWREEPARNGGWADLTLRNDLPLFRSIQLIVNQRREGYCIVGVQYSSDTPRIYDVTGVKRWVPEVERKYGPGVAWQVQQRLYSRQSRLFPSEILLPTGVTVWGSILESQGKYQVAGLTAEEWMLLELSLQELGASDPIWAYYAYVNARHPLNRVPVHFTRQVHEVMDIGATIWQPDHALFALEQFKALVRATQAT
jgi:hypothetical protein